MNKEENFSLKQSSASQSFFSFDSEEFITPKDSFVFAIQSKNELSIIQGEINEYTKNLFQLLSDNHEKEFFYVKAIKNLIKQKEYLNLLYQASNELISDEEFNFELNENEDKYLIKIDDKLNDKKLRLLSNVINNLNENLSEDDVSEMFSVRTTKI